ncbi:hypothetical protein BDV96DRAFT_104796 [Lophiotrema nucula]|uniref:Uncharacterized protein n=1 Tax=Lophiotrema nucula TaxID=690887 RepID=A0A6A5Z6A3_9PLEO|nr:hypothetical protein BDV96DRAFT_104796 [Lophiotrema nucula]
MCLAVHCQHDHCPHPQVSCKVHCEHENCALAQAPHHEETCKHNTHSPSADPHSIDTAHLRRRLHYVRKGLEEERRRLHRHHRVASASLEEHIRGLEIRHEHDGTYPSQEELDLQDSLCIAEHHRWRAEDQLEERLEAQLRELEELELKLHSAKELEEESVSDIECLQKRHDEKHNRESGIAKGIEEGLKSLHTLTLHSRPSSPASSTMSSDTRDSREPQRRQGRHPSYSPPRRERYHSASAYQSPVRRRSAGPRQSGRLYVVRRPIENRPHPRVHWADQRGHHERSGSINTPHRENFFS